MDRPYPRETPKAATVLADSENNRGVSLLDLGRPGDAEACFLRANGHSPKHPQATYNLGLLQWRSGKVTDVELLGQLSNVSTDPDPWLARYLEGLVQTERGAIVVDALNRTNVAGIYAIGDVAGPPLLARRGHARDRGGRGAGVRP